MRRFNDEVEDWRGFLTALRTDDRVMFRRMITDLQRYADIIGKQENSSEALILALILQQYKTVQWLESEVQRLKSNKG